MIEIGNLNGFELGESPTDEIASAYVHNVRQMLFKTGYPGNNLMDTRVPAPSFSDCSYLRTLT